MWNKNDCTGWGDYRILFRAMKLKFEDRTIYTLQLNKINSASISIYKGIPFSLIFQIIFKVKI